MNKKYTKNSISTYGGGGLGLGGYTSTTLIGGGGVAGLGGGGGRGF